MITVNFHFCRITEIWPLQFKFDYDDDDDDGTPISCHGNFISRQQQYPQLYRKKKNFLSDSINFYSHSFIHHFIIDHG